MKKLDEDRARVRAIVIYMKKFWRTYDQQYGYQSYSDETIIKDAIYGLGVAIDPANYQFAVGFERFKKRLREQELA